MPPQPAAVELLTALAPVLARWGRWYVFGAQAVIVYGVPRLSADVDVTLALNPKLLHRDLHILNAHDRRERTQKSAAECALEAAHG